MELWQFALSSAIGALIAGTATFIEERRGARRADRVAAAERADAYRRELRDVHRTLLLVITKGIREVEDAVGTASIDGYYAPASICASELPPPMDDVAFDTANADLLLTEDDEDLIMWGTSAVHSVRTVHLALGRCLDPEGGQVPTGGELLDFLGQARVSRHKYSVAVQKRIRALAVR